MPIGWAPIEVGRVTQHEHLRPRVAAYGRHVKLATEGEMEADPKVLEAVTLLRQAGRLDLLKEGALEPGRPARRASAGVAAAVAACSPPRVAEKVSGVSKGAGAGARGGTGAAKGKAARPARRAAAPRDSLEAGHGLVRPGGRPTRGGRARPRLVLRPQGSCIDITGALGTSAAGGRGSPGKARAHHARAAGPIRKGLKIVGSEGPGAELSRGGGTPDLVWQGPLDYEEDDPGEQEAARLHWEEEKATPWVASRMASTGRSRRWAGAVEASSGLSGGVGFAPPDAAAWEEQRPGPSRRTSSIRGEYSGVIRCCGEGVDARQRDEGVSDESLEEGELRSGSEHDWWERKGRGTSNPVRQSLQVQRTVRWPWGSRKEHKVGEARTVQV
ncbi:hypothetical protein NDU88_001451 [Pleurodeles waltl]|uniref:Uncharacterized protein n=1 Tax=Pleurodeles waltl TaxID=8319 RepID=A0AAV7VAF2_PLEWA|nr:hypothetical protein NDU88_001451 [Pleurodeles waltl]